MRGSGKLYYERYKLKRFGNGFMHLAIPYAPVSLPVILPAKVHLNFGAPMYFDDLEIPEEQVTQRVEQVKAEIRRQIDKGLSERKRLF